MADLQDVLGKLKNVKQTGEGQYECQCPAHEDKKASLHVAQGDKGIVLDCKAGCATPHVVYAIGMTMYELFPPSEKTGKNGKITAVYDYHNADGDVAFQVVRFENKEFSQRKDADNWSKGAMKGVRRVLYRLPEVIAADTVLLAEGEKDVNNLREAGFVATCNPGGAAVSKADGKPTKKWLSQYNDTLAGKHVVILPDHDKPNDHGQRPGTGHALYVASQLLGKAASVKIVELPVDVGKDVSDWLAAGGTADELRRIIDDTPEWTATSTLGLYSHAKAKTPADRIKDAGGDSFGEDILAALKLDVLGEIEGGKIKVFSESQRKCDTIRDINRVSYPDLLRICGSEAIGVVFDGQGETPPGMHSIRKIREAIAYIAGKRRIGDDSESGIGVWPGKADDGEENDALVFVGAGEAAALNGHPELIRVKKPRYGERLLDLSGSDPWYDFDRLRSDINEANDPDWRAAAVADSDALWSRWAWHNEIDPKIITGLILATWVQTVWRWRPQVMITGESSSGKSTLFAALAGSDHLLGLFGRLAVKSSGSTAAGLRQSIASTAGVLLCDEFDSGRYRREVLEMLRSSGGGDTVLRGTSGQKRMQFRMRHIAWVAGIESGLERDPDRNRFVSLELIKPSRSEIGKLRLPDESDLTRLGFRLLATVARTIRDAKRMVDLFRSNAPDGFSVRVVESYAVPAACYAAALNMDEANAVATFLDMIDRHDDSESESDGDSLINSLMSSMVDIGKGQRKAVSEILYRSVHAGTEELDALERHGVAPVGGSGEDEFIFIAHTTAKKYLFRGTEWEHARIDQILSRIPGAKKHRKIMFGRYHRGILIPAATNESLKNSEPVDTESLFEPF